MTWKRVPIIMLYKRNLLWPHFLLIIPFLLYHQLQLFVFLSSFYWIYIFHFALYLTSPPFPFSLYFLVYCRNVYFKTCHTAFFVLEWELDKGGLKIQEICIVFIFWLSREIVPSSVCNNNLYLHHFYAPKT